MISILPILNYTTTCAHFKVHFKSGGCTPLIMTSILPILNCTPTCAHLKAHFKSGGCTLLK
jgi:hypothetical protein